ncbi:MAG: hypothetical protein KU37_07535 [Sulfuricurvum sp. PC08-66]|nr:MAG: hypothetical protein KU37_07535 [Sulfuricurvum sp. PC08-66]
MLGNYLTKALEDLNSLINFTYQDIEDIKIANHEAIFSRASLKEELITSFQNKKTLLDNEIAKLMAAYPNESLEHLVEPDQMALLKQLKEHLETLKVQNKRYARLVLSVTEFFNSLLERMVPVEMHGYRKITPKHRSLLEVRA